MHDVQAGGHTLSHTESIPMRAILVLLTLFSAAWCPGMAWAQTRPNVVYILADDLGYGDLGCYGQRTLSTPHIDRMAAESMRFTQHYAGSTVCAPSRCVLLTGLHTGHTPIRGNDASLLRDEDVTIAELLRDAGYATGCAGKWGVGHPPPLDDPLRNGFDFFYGYINMYHAHNFWPDFMVRNGHKLGLRNEQYPGFEEPADREGRGVARRKVTYAPNLITDEALTFIETHREQPFFLYLAFNRPHANNEAGGDARANHNGMEVPDWGDYAGRDWPIQERGFARMMQMVDDDVGRVLAKLNELGLDERTLVIFSSDNGPHQEGGHLMPFFDSNGDLQGLKRDLYDGGIRVPMIARWPGQISPGTISDHVSAFQDVLPTLCDVAGVEPPACDGISFLPTLMGRPADQNQHPHLYWEFYEQGGKVAVRLHQWKGIRLSAETNPDAPIALYDVTQDVAERTNVADQHPEVVQQIADIMRAEHRDRE